MPKEYFSPERAASLASLPAGAHIHVSGVAGVAMAQLAVALSERGFTVSGSDKDFYEPMGSFLRSSAVTLHQGYAGANIGADVALVVIGNALSYGNEEILEVERRGIPYSFFPKVLHDLVIDGRSSIVATGTHGKSTTTAMTAFVLESLQRSPSYFVGAVVPELPRSLRVGTGSCSVVEGDEYDSAFFAKVPKFSFYAPTTAIITAIEYDHADIYPNLDAIVQQFTNLVRTLPQTGTLICCIDCPTIRSLLPEWRSIFKGTVITYGTSSDAEWCISGIQTEGRSQNATVSWRGENIKLTLAVPGNYNLKNASAALLALQANGVALSSTLPTIATFSGAKRRQEVRFDDGKITLIDDFAHHPTAVNETIAAIRRAYPGKKLWAIFEPRSNTSRRKVFQQAYIDAFTQADVVFLAKPMATAIDEGLELLDVGELAQHISASGPLAKALPDSDQIIAHLIPELGRNDVVLIMSNGGFGGIVQKLEALLRRK